MGADTNVELFVIHSPPRSIMSLCDNGGADLIPFSWFIVEVANISQCYVILLAWAAMIISNYKQAKYCLNLTTADTKFQGLQPFSISWAFSPDIQQ